MQFRVESVCGESVASFGTRLAVQRKPKRLPRKAGATMAWSALFRLI